MTKSEILKEIVKDLNEVNTHFGKHYETCFKRQILQSTTFPFVPSPLHFTSSRKNKYLIYVEAKKRGDWKPRAYYCVCNVGNMAYMCDNKLSSLYVFAPHFFSRYRQRFIKDSEITTQQVIERYFRRNLIISYKLRGSDNTFIGTCNDGIVFGTYKDDFAVIKTFISRDMQFDNQKTLCDNLDKCREKIWKRIA